jgi:hypothetical protein
MDSIAARVLQLGASTQADRPVTSVSLMSNGLAFNAIDAQAGGTWRLENGEVEIIWSSGWLTRFAPKEQGPLQVRIWEPGTRPPAAPTALRPGQRLWPGSAFRRRLEECSGLAGPRLPRREPKPEREFAKAAAPSPAPSARG